MNTRSVRKRSRARPRRNSAIAIISTAMPEKIAPTTKYGPKIVLFQPGVRVIAKSQDTIVCTETATGMIATARMRIPHSRLCHCCAVPRQPSARTA